MLTPLDKMTVWLDGQIAERRRLLAALEADAVVPTRAEILASGLARVPATADSPAALALTEPPDAKQSPAGRAEDVPNVIREAVKRLRHEIAWLTLWSQLGQAVQRDNWGRIDAFRTAIEKPPGRTYEDRQEALR